MRFITEAFIIRNMKKNYFICGFNQHLKFVRVYKRLDFFIAERGYYRKLNIK